MARAALKFFFSNIFLVVLFLFRLHLSFFLPCVSLCQCFLCGVEKTGTSLLLCVCVCVCVCTCQKQKKEKDKKKKSLKENKLFSCAGKGSPSFTPMVLSHPSGTLEKKKKEKKLKKRKKFKRKAFFLCRAGITIFPMVLSHPSGTLVSEKKVKSFCLSPSLQQQHQGTTITSATVSVLEVIWFPDVAATTTWVFSS